ncbi:armadillo-type protein [Globomyces pollinis-pini]|nr:armadillo-type protein [Globomyces pollinis-pini]
MSLASLDKPDASFDHSDSYSLHSYPHESSDNSYHPKLRSRNSEPNIYMQNIIESNNSYGICRYFLQGYCSRGDRCHFAHVTNLPQVQQRSQFNVPYNSHPNINPNKHAHSTSSSPQFFPGPSAVGVPTPKLGASKVKKTPEEEVNRFLSVEVKDLVGQIYYFCKDQYGCRYLQKQIEEHEKDVISIIFNDIFQNFAELMIDPFGNYLCQKLIEYCTEEQRGEIVQQVSTNLIEISLNIHGTRAVQKLIEFVNVHDQTETIINALNVDPVSLIKDLNGNHVIQKCLSKLSHIDNQFVFDAVSRNCMQVATHRHGCCVLQRCIDHATDIQRSQLVNEIARHALALVQDPFGNYVVQYVLDLGEIKYSECIVKPFIGNVCLLSVQKFSSNVIEKCIRVSGQKLRASLINELLDQDRLEKLLCDSFANYVVQTALDYAAPDQRVKLIDCIRPILPVIRNTPYGKRIQSKFLRDGVPNYTQLAYNTGLTVTKPFL